MKMTKENLEHIKKRFEQETGTKLPGKEPVDLHPYITRFAAAAAGLLCLAGAGLAWNKIGANKQANPASAPSTPTVTLSAPAAIALEPDSLGDTDVEPVTDPEPTPAFELETTAEVVDTQEFSTPAEVSDPFTLNTVTNLEFNEALFGPETDWTFPVPASEDRGLVLSDVTSQIVETYSSDSDKESGTSVVHYISIPGNIGDPVLAMHAGTVTETGCTPEDGNFIRTDIGTCILIYSPLDSISVSSG
ncbi:MAG: hypothetical protein IKO10_01025, partial [Lachnospiraceae bacterium]|nr:hypothetical protein [Lachnospiraceae bacterium]